ncbi:MAG: response regulator [Kofleriaceae bacterium]
MLHHADPDRPPNPADTPPRSPHRRRRPDGVRPTVVVAEDDDELRHLMATKLRARGCVVVEVATGIALAEQVAHHGATIELVISDVRMPGLTGLEVIELVRHIDWGLPVIVVTGFGDADTHAEGLRLGARVFDKPVDLDELAAAAGELLGLDR